jgi:hypothetical protein
MMCNKYTFVIILVGVLAVHSYGATITLGDSYGTTRGGEFTATYAGFPITPIAGSDSAPDQFQTFCIETNEYISFGTTYYAEISTEAILGGVGGGSPDPLDPLTAYLYASFISGTLMGYDYAGAQRAASADALQHVIWFIEDEEPKAWTDGNGSLMDQFYQAALAGAGSDIGNVRVLNLYADEGHTQNVQDQLVMLPEPGTLLLVLGAMSLLMIRRKAL